MSRIIQESFRKFRGSEVEWGKCLQEKINYADGGAIFTIARLPGRQNRITSERFEKKNNESGSCSNLNFDTSVQ